MSQWEHVAPKFYPIRVEGHTYEKHFVLKNFSLERLLRNAVKSKLDNCHGGGLNTSEGYNMNSFCKLKIGARILMLSELWLPPLIITKEFTNVFLYQPAILHITPKIRKNKPLQHSYAVYKTFPKSIAVVSKVMLNVQLRYLT